MREQLLIISHTRHCIGRDGRLAGWAPTVLENDVIGKSFKKVVLMGELHSGLPPRNFMPYRLNNLRFIPLHPRGGSRIIDKLKLLFHLPVYFYQIHRQVSSLGSKDWIYVRCPCNIGLVACAYLALSRRRRRWFKYGGNWDPLSRQPWSHSLQRWALERNFCRGVVTINGTWDNQASHLQTFNNPCMTLEENREADRATHRKKITFPIRILFAGRIEREKGIFEIPKIAEELLHSQIDFHMDLVGDGRHFKKLEIEISKKELGHRISLRGEQDRKDLKKYYMQAHFLLLPSRSEGWPKVISEAMAYRCVPLASAVGSIPQILDTHQCGASLEDQDPQTWAGAIETFLLKPRYWKETADRGQTCSRQFTYDRMEQDIRTRILSV